MARINLLPWREWDRERKKREFLTNLALVVALACGAVYGYIYYLDESFSHQQARNRYMDAQLTVLEEKIKEIRTLREEREALTARMRVIQELQGNRPVIVHVFDDMVRTLTDGVHYNKLTMSGTGISVVGSAESNNRVSALMRNLDESDWFADPNLKSIKENASLGAQGNDFRLTVRQINPNVANTQGSEGS